MEINQRVIARIFRVEEYCLYAEAEQQEILIVAAQTSWVPIALRESFSVGETVEVLLLRYIPELNAFLGSLKALQENPYQALLKLPPQDILMGRVVHLNDQVVCLQLPNSA